MRYRNPIQDSQEEEGLWSKLFGLYHDPRTHTLPDILNSTRDICWRLADFGVPTAESDEFLRGHILRVLLQCTDFDIVRICHWVELKNEDLAQLSYRLHCYHGNQPPGPEVAVMDGAELQVVMSWQDGDEESDGEMPELIPGSAEHREEHFRDILTQPFHGVRPTRQELAYAESKCQQS